jgi:hypothetical protein
MRTLKDTRKPKYHGKPRDQTQELWSLRDFNGHSIYIIIGFITLPLEWSCTKNMSH